MCLNIFVKVCQYVREKMYLCLNVYVSTADINSVEGIWIFLMQI